MSDTLRITECFLSLQGEGKRSNHPSIFLRLFGCNLTCPKFSLPAAMSDTEALGMQKSALDKIAKDTAECHNVRELPLMMFGCDSYISWHKDFRRFSPEMDNTTIMSTIRAQVPNGDISGYDLVITGGEPLLKPNQRKLISFFEQFKDELSKVPYITFETNGTQTLTREFDDWIRYGEHPPIIFSISPKLSCAGNGHDRSIVPEAIASMVRTGCETYLKFVANSREDTKEIKDTIKELNYSGDIYIMPEGGIESAHNAKAVEIANLCIHEKWIFCPRIHVLLWKNQWAT